MVYLPTDTQIYGIYRFRPFVDVNRRMFRISNALEQNVVCYVTSNQATHFMQSVDCVCFVSMLRYRAGDPNLCLATLSCT